MDGLRSKHTCILDTHTHTQTHTDTHKHTNKHIYTHTHINTHTHTHIYKHTHTHTHTHTSLAPLSTDTRFVLFFSHSFFFPKYAKLYIFRKEILWAKR